jgi:hypothetical protein
MSAYATLLPCVVLAAAGGDSGARACFVVFVAALGAEGCAKVCSTPDLIRALVTTVLAVTTDPPTLGVADAGVIVADGVEKVRHKEAGGGSTLI